MPQAARMPVVMYHGVDRRDPNWLWNHLTVDTGLFAAQIALLKGHGYTSASLDDLRECQETGRIPAQPRVVLTFDDAYLDNWVYAYPLLRREGWTGVIYVNPEFIDPSDEPRPTLLDVWDGRCAESDLRSRGFLNRAELRLLQESGVMTIASHSMSHTWYPQGPKIMDYHRPGLATPWLAWNARPEQKFAYLVEDQVAFTPWGTPIHAHGRSLGIRRWLPAEEPIAAARHLVAEQGGAAFFRREDWRNKLDAATAASPGEGRAETDEEMVQRFRYEIHESRRQLEDILGVKVDHFCWPGGAYCDAAWDVLDEAEYRTVTITSGDRRRWQSDDPRFVRRIGAANQFYMGGKRRATRNPKFLLDLCEIERGDAHRRWRLRIRKILASLRPGSA